MDISLSKYNYRHLGALERDLDSFNRIAGLPVEIVEALHRLYTLVRSGDGALFLRSPLLDEFVEFLRRLPEGLVPRYYATRIVAGRTDQAIRAHLKTLPVENFCALRCVACFVRAVCFQAAPNGKAVSFETLDREKRLIEALTPEPRDDRFRPLLIRLFQDPARFFSK